MTQLGVSISKTVSSYYLGFGSIEKLAGLLAERKKNADDFVVFFVDEFFKDQAWVHKALGITARDYVTTIACTDEELTTDMVDSLTEGVRAFSKKLPVAIVAFGGGSTLDAVKAVSNMLTNTGKAADYQGWDLVKVPGVFKIGIPTLSGTGAEASRTCVMLNREKNIKLGMNSPHSVFDHLVLDPTFSKTVPRDQYFYTAMDTYIHCVESLRGQYRHPIADLYSQASLDLVRDVMSNGDMMSDENREKVLIASFLGGSAIGNSYVGVVHPLSAGLSTVFGTHHCLANCVVMPHMREFYPEETEEFLKFCRLQNITLPAGLCRDASEDTYRRLYQSSTVHEKPLTNALGSGFREILTASKVQSLYQNM